MHMDADSTEWVMVPRGELLNVRTALKPLTLQGEDNIWRRAKAAIGSIDAWLSAAPPTMGEEELREILADEYARVRPGDTYYAQLLQGAAMVITDDMVEAGAKAIHTAEARDARWSDDIIEVDWLGLRNRPGSHRLAQYTLYARAALTAALAAKGSEGTDA